MILTGDNSLFTGEKVLAGVEVIFFNESGTSLPKFIANILNFFKIESSSVVLAQNFWLSLLDDNEMNPNLRSGLIYIALHKN